MAGMSDEDLLRANVRLNAGATIAQIFDHGVIVVDWLPSLRVAVVVAEAAVLHELSRQPFVGSLEYDRDVST